MTVIIVTGTPGTGKTTVAHLIEKKLGYYYVDVNTVVEEKKLCEEYDTEKDCKIVDVDRLNNALLTVIAEHTDTVVDSHMSHYLPKERVDLCVVTKCQLGVLKRRLEARGYKEKKVRENMDAEIFDNCLIEADEAGHEVLIVDTTHDVDEEEVIEKIKESI